MFKKVRGANKSITYIDYRDLTENKKPRNVSVCIKRYSCVSSGCLQCQRCHTATGLSMGGVWRQNPNFEKFSWPFGHLHFYLGLNRPDKTRCIIRPYLVQN